MAKVTLTYYVDVLSSWCLIAEDALAKVLGQFAGQVDYEWRIAALRHPLNYTPEQLKFYYSRTNAVTGVMLNPVWLESTADGTWLADVTAEAARGLGCTDDTVRLALARGAMVDGKHMSRRDVVVDTAARAGGLDPAALSQAMDDPRTAERIAESSAEFVKLNVNVRPTFVVRNTIGDISVLSGCWRHDLLANAVKAHVEDQRIYDKFMVDNRAPAGVV